MELILISILFVLVVPIVLLSIFVNKLWNKNQELVLNHSSEIKELNKEIRLLQKSNRTTQLEREAEELRSEASRKLKDTEELENKAKNKLKNIEDLIKINIGDRGLYSNYGLVWGDTGEGFKVDYEVEIVEISEDKLKIKGINYTSSNARVMKSGVKQGTLKHVENIWVDKGKISIIVSANVKRDITLNRVLN